MITHLQPQPQPWPPWHSTPKRATHTANPPPFPTSSRSPAAYTRAQPQTRPPRAQWIHMVYGLLVDSDQLDARARALVAQKGWTSAPAPAAGRRNGSSANAVRSVGALREWYVHRIPTEFGEHATGEGEGGREEGEEKRSRREITPKPRLCAVRTQEGAIRLCVALAENIEVEVGIGRLPNPLPLDGVVEGLRPLLGTQGEPGWYELFC